MKAIIVCLAFVAGCATAETRSTPQTQLASRIEHASTHNPCPPNQPVSGSCLDDQGLVWSACAWNGCGRDTDCRHHSQEVIASHDCGLPDWPACHD